MIEPEHCRRIAVASGKNTRNTDKISLWLPAVNFPQNQMSELKITVIKKTVVFKPPVGVREALYVIRCNLYYVIQLIIRKKKDMRLFCG